MGVIDSMSMGMKVYDVSPKYEYMAIKEVDGVTKIWGAYMTYYRWEWDNTKRFANRDKVILFSGTVGKKLRYGFSYCPNRIETYKRKHIKEGYQLLNKDDYEKYQFVHDGVSKLLMWDTLRK